MPLAIWTLASGKTEIEERVLGRQHEEFTIQLKDFFQHWHKLQKESSGLYIRSNSHWSLEPVLSWFGTGRQREMKMRRKTSQRSSKTCVLYTQQAGLGQEIPVMSGLSGVHGVDGSVTKWALMTGVARCSIVKLFSEAFLSLIPPSQSWIVWYDTFDSPGTQMEEKGVTGTNEIETVPATQEDFATCQLEKHCYKDILTLECRGKYDVG